MAQPWRDNTWRLVDAGSLSPLEVHAIYESVARSVSEEDSPNTLILCYPSTRYISVGYHQSITDEVDVDKARDMGILVVRRQVGGGTVLLDDKQLFYHIVVHRNSSYNIRPLRRFFEYFLKPTICVYRRIGIPAKYKPLNDVVVGDRKISGNGAAQLYDAMVLVGNIIIDIDLDLMTSLLRVPDEKFRDKLARSMREWVSSIKRELGYKPSMDYLKKLYIECFQEELGLRLIPGNLSSKEKIWVKEIINKLGSREWLYEPLEAREKLTRRVKVKEGLFVVEKTYRAKKTLRLLGVIDGDTVIELKIYGDFFIIPSNGIERLEKMLIGKRLDEIDDVIRKWYKDVELPGVNAEDLINAIRSLSR